MLHSRVRRVTLTIAAVLAGTLATGCGAVSDSDVVARVDDVELSREQFADLVADRQAALGVPAGPAAARVDGQTARGIIGQFVTLELVRTDLTALGVAIPEVESGLTPGERLDAEYEALGQAWVSSGELIADERLRNWYDGAGSAEVVCAAHILVEEEATANATLARLDSGEAFEVVAGDTSIDPQSAAQGGLLGCQPTSEFRRTFIPEFVDAALAAEIGVPTAPVESDFGFHIIRLAPFDTLGGNDLLVARLIALDDWHDVETDPEIGVWSFPAVAPLG